MLAPTATLTIAQDEEELARMGAKYFSHAARAAIERNSRFTVVLSGGNTPRRLFTRLATAPFESSFSWDHVHFFWGDERNVAPDSSDSNFHMAWETMLAPLSIRAANIHRFRTELKSPNQVADDYEKMLRSFFGIRKRSQRPRFDLVLLGLGIDGHTASLFPDGRPGISINSDLPDRLAIATWVAHLNEFRFSLTPAALNQTDQVLFLVSGREKATILEKVIGPGSDGSPFEATYPAQIIRPVKGRVVWLADQDAAKFVTKVNGQRAS